MASVADITAKLLEPFPVEVIEEKNGLLYIPHEIIRDRLISATDNQFDWSIDQILFRDDGVTRRANDRYTGEAKRPHSMLVIGTLTIPGLGSRAGIGAHPLDEGAGEDAAYKSAESDAIKRAAMGFGVGLHQLYIETGEAKRVSQGRSNARNQATRSGDTNRGSNAPQRAPAQRDGVRPQTAGSGRPASKPKPPVEEREPKPDQPIPADPQAFGLAFKTALGKKDALETERLMEAADTQEDRWIALIEVVESPQALDWIGRQLERKGIADTPRIKDAFTKRFTDINDTSSTNKGEAEPAPEPDFRTQAEQAVKADDAKKFAELGTTAGDDPKKWAVLIDVALRVEALDWIGRQLDARRMHDAKMKALIKARKTELAAMRAG